MKQRSGCPICNSTTYEAKLQLNYDDFPVEDLIKKYYADRVDFSYLQDGEFSILYCPDDDFYWKEHVLTDEGMKKLYGDWVPDAHFGTRPPNRYDDFAPEKTIERASRIKSYFDRHPTDMKVLDFGAGWCYFAQALAYLGFNTYAYEVSSDKLATAEQYGIQTISAQDELSGMEFDYIHASEVLEHVPNPATMIELLSDLLAEDGLCYVTVPDADFSGPFSERIITDGVNAFHPLEHVNGFTGKSLRALLNRYGLTTTRPPRPTLFNSCLEKRVNDILEREEVKYPIYRLVNEYGVKKYAKVVYQQHLGGSDRYDEIDFMKRDESESCEDYQGIDFQPSGSTSRTFRDVVMSLGKSLFDADLITNCYFEKK